MKTIQLFYIERLYGELSGLGYDWLEENFDLSLISDQDRFFDSAKKIFIESGPITQSRTLDAIEYILAQRNIDSYNGFFIPSDLPPWDISDKRDFLNRLYTAIASHPPNPEKFLRQNILEVREPLKHWHPAD